LFTYFFIYLDSVYKQQRSEDARNVQLCLHLTTRLTERLQPESR